VAGGLGDIAGLGVTLGAMGGVINMTKDVINPVLQTTAPAGEELAATLSDTWNCSCGKTHISGNFCSNCGAKRPSAGRPWNCSCGNQGIIGNFCNLCGRKRTEEREDVWDCTCGNKGITGKFCNICGRQRSSEMPQTNHQEQDVTATAEDTEQNQTDDAKGEE
jgi:membrane protease subunit (stomatin/prohibitin family)